MFRDITLGQYYGADSVIHRLDPRVKLAGTLIFIITLFIGKSFFMYIPAGIFLVSVILLSKVPVSFVLRGIKPVIPLIILSAVFNLILTPGNAILSFWIINITTEGIYLAVFMIVRLLFLITGASVLTLTTTPTKLTDGMEKGLRFLTVFKVPVDEIAMMMSIALRFIPTLLGETDKIMKAQQARGADFESGNIFQRAKSLIPILVPLFISAFRIASDLAMAMEARCYRGGRGRTRMNAIKFGKNDVFAGVLAVLLIASLIIYRRFI